LFYRRAEAAEQVNYVTGNVYKRFTSAEKAAKFFKTGANVAVKAGFPTSTDVFVVVGDESRKIYRSR
jgi:viroplasmin and RNaseH domain-containing protein